MASTNMSGTFNPFERHVGKPEPAQAQPDAETTGEQPVDSKPAAEPDSVPEDQSRPAAPVAPRAARAENPFGHLRIEPKAQPKLEPERPPRLLLDWLRHSWTKPVISLRDIQAYGPTEIRDRATALSQAETLASHGWLAELKAHRRDRRVWRLPPTVA
jgi:hypothetical protein